MWKNMTWLAAEWRYWHEWRSMAMAARLEGKDEIPERNNPFRYTFRWFGVAVAMPLTVVFVLVFLGYLIMQYEAAAQIAMGVAVILAIVTWLFYIIYSLVTMGENGPNRRVVDRWKQMNGQGKSS